jgi:hypothetical protein
VLEATLDGYTTYAGAATGERGVALLAKERGDDPSDTGESPCFAHVTNSMARIEGDFEKGEADGATATLALLAAAAKAWQSGRINSAN